MHSIESRESFVNRIFSIFHFNKFWHASRHDLVASFLMINLLQIFFGIKRAPIKSIFPSLNFMNASSSSISRSKRDSKWMRWLIITKKIWAAEVICLRNFLLSSSLQISMSSCSTRLRMMLSRFYHHKLFFALILLA